MSLLRSAMAIGLLVGGAALAGADRPPRMTRAELRIAPLTGSHAKEWEESTRSRKWDESNPDIRSTEWLFEELCFQDGVLHEGSSDQLRTLDLIKRERVKVRSAFLRNVDCERPAEWNMEYEPARVTAARYLAQIGEPGIEPILAGLLDSPERAERIGAMRALLSFCPFDESSTARKLIELIERSASNNDRREASSAASALMVCGTPEIAALLTKRITLAPPEATEELTSALDAVERYRRELAAGPLTVRDFTKLNAACPISWYRSPTHPDFTEARDLMRLLCSQRLAEVSPDRRAHLERLAAMERLTLRVVVERGVFCRTGFVWTDAGVGQGTAADLLLAIGDQPTIDRLVSFLDDADPVNVALAIDSLVPMVTDGNAELGARIRAFVFSEDPNVRKATLAALKRMGPLREKRIIDYLIREVDACFALPRDEQYQCRELFRGPLYNGRSLEVIDAVRSRRDATPTDSYQRRDWENFVENAMREMMKADEQKK